MQEWVIWAEIVVAAIVLVLLAVVTLALRRRWLARGGGTFECSLQLRASTPGGGWALGVARYNDENLEWFRFFSYSVGPRKTFRRDEIVVINSREPEPAEAVALYAGQRIVRLEISTVAAAETYDLAMSSESMTGMLSWLEAAPPGVKGY